MFRESPVRLAIVRIERWSRNTQRRITLKNAMSITPNIPADVKKGEVQKGVTSQQKLPVYAAQLSGQFNNGVNNSHRHLLSTPAVPVARKYDSTRAMLRRNKIGLKRK